MKDPKASLSAFGDYPVRVSVPLLQFNQPLLPLLPCVQILLGELLLKSYRCSALNWR
jgi:hypothetical protein